MDLSRSYPRGTYARHDGGIIRSFRDTIPGAELRTAGWEVAIAGVADLGVSQGDDPREFSVLLRLTGGELRALQFRIPCMIYREIYKPDAKYRQGDVVTWGGSAWHCQVDDPKSSPGKNGEWKLMVKEGQRGKDGKDGQPGPEGPPGRDGKDLTQLAFDGKKH